jgi:threonine dehydratase
MSRTRVPVAPAPAPARPAVTIEDVRRAAAALEGVAMRTPLVEIPALAALTGHSVALKCEQLQPIGAFKVRGAYNAIQCMPPAVRARGVITYSSGNHGQAVAWAAARVGVRAVIVMPETAPQVKLAGVRALGGEVVFAGTRSVDRKKKAEEICAAEGLAMIPPFDHPDVIAGQGTCGLEILEQWPDVHTILVPVGGGGLLAGICVAVAAVRPKTRVVAVEPEGAAKLTAALRAGAPAELERTASLADGLLPLAVGDLTFPLIRPVVQEVVTVSDDDIARAMRLLYHEAGLRVEPSGAVTAAAILSGRVRPCGVAVAVASGGNVDEEFFDRLVS